MQDAATTRDPATRAVLRALTESLRHQAGVREGDGVLVACSGGADSVALLRAMHGLAPKRRWRLRVEVAHVQHHLRDTAERDAAFVARLAEHLGLAHHRRDLDLRAGAATTQADNLEARAAEARYAALAEVAAKRGLFLVATAHHADDQLETLLMRLLRGSAIRGMAGIAPVRALSPQARLIRPLLGVTRSTLRSYLQRLNQPWHEDESNDDATRTRAALRRGVLPTLLSMRPDLPQRLRDWTQHAAQLQALLEHAADEVVFPLSRDAARRENPAVLQAALQRALLARGEPADRVSSARLRAVSRAIRDTDGRPRRFGWSRCRVCIDAQTVWVSCVDEAGDLGEP